MTYGIFDEQELELIEASKMILAEGLHRLQERDTLFTGRRAQKRDCMSARGVLTDKLIADYGSLRYEMAIIVLFDAQGRLITIEPMAQGKATECEINGRILAQLILKHGAVAVLFAHNHPSGNNDPSTQDLRMTTHYKDWLRTLECELIDHLVLNGESATSILGAWND